MVKKRLYAYIHFVFLDIIIDVLIFLTVFFYSLAHRRNNFHHIFGTAIALLGLILRIFSRVHLGDCFSVRTKAKKLITKGIYSKISHPIYLFSSLAFAGVFISLWRHRLFLILILFLCIQMVRASQETRILQRAFGEEYKAYRKKIWF